MKKLRVLFVVLMTVLTVNIEAQTRTVTGVITDEQGSAIPGVSIISRITNQSAISDVHGKYAIKVSGNNDVLRFAFIGMKAVEVKVEYKSKVDVTMEADVCEMEEVVVVGYGVQRKMSISGAVSGVKIRGNKSRKRRDKAQNSQVAYLSPPNYVHECSNENYATISENGYKEAVKQPLSTFSVDVDRASYANVRRFLNNGQLPPHDAVRIEEMINYFDYDYREPDGDHPFGVKSEMAECPWNDEHYLLKVGLKGQEIDKDNLPPSNLVFLIDVSGSMSSYNKLPLLKSSFRLLVNELRPEDYVSMVVYAGAAGVVLEPTSGENKQEILAALDKLESGGSTAGGAGLKRAYELAKKNYQKHANNRIILATDGDFNVGFRSNEAMEDLVAKERDSGIYMTVLGFGMGNYKDDRMEVIANKGNGNYAYIDNLQEAQKILVSEFGGTLFTIAKDVKFQIEFNPAKVLGYRLIGYENRLLNDEDFNDDSKDAGEIGAGHTVTALYEIIPVGARDGKKWVKKVDKLKYQQTHEPKLSLSDEWLTLKLRYKKPDAKESVLITQTLKGKMKTYKNASEDFRFAASVAGFGMLLRESPYMGDINYKRISDMASLSKGKDEEGYKAEMLRLINIAESLNASMASR
ncbi:vWA domain-containing protein [Carboxylicivirga marina]|uniref:vWA domain-containing protein n=1 Tax=Carboxylicivirga marina TaxID=2800988 RepID=UPI00259A0EA5|nr:von Willebrand factor type A domain-containing protein [uncultured Carboxylicivirga sp.]